MSLPAECAEFFHSHAVAGAFAEEVAATTDVVPLADTAIPAGHDIFEDLKFLLAGFVNKHLTIRTVHDLCIYNEVSRNLYCQAIMMLRQQTVLRSSSAPP